MLELVITLILGIIIGTFTGLFPGIHINLVSAFVISSLAFLTGYFDPLSLVIFIVSMSITHSFLDFIPSIYLGAPDDDSSLATMPGHKLLMKGKANIAIIYTFLGCIYGVIFSILITPLLIFLLPKIYPFIERMMSFILVLISIFLISKEQSSKFFAFFVFILSGFLGLATFNLNISQPLLPLLSGLFGASTLIFSISQNTQIPQQKVYKLNIKNKILRIIKPAIITSLVSPICSFLPGMGSSQSALVSSQFIKTTRRQFLFLLGTTSLITMSLSFPALYIISKSRTGSAAAISDILTLTQKDLVFIFIAILISAFFAFYIGLKLSSFFATNISKINYSKLSFFILIVISISVIFFSGFLGFLVFIASTTLGLFAIYASIRKGHLLGCLLIPTILYYLPF